MKLPVTDWRCERLATLLIQLRLVRNKGWSTSSPANTSDVLSLMSEITALRKEAGNLAPTKVQVNIVEGVQGAYVCRFCQKTNVLEPGRYEPLPDTPQSAPAPSPAPRQIEAQSPSDDAPTSPVTNIVPIVAERRVPESPHKGWTLANGQYEAPPLKRLRASDWHRNIDPHDLMQQEG